MTHIVKHSTHTWTITNDSQSKNNPDFSTSFSGSSKLYQIHTKLYIQFVPLSIFNANQKYRIMPCGDDGGTKIVN